MKQYNSRTEHAINGEDRVLEAARQSNTDTKAEKWIDREQQTEITTITKKKTYQQSDGIEQKKFKI